jgi:hypothetical protein
MQNEEMLILKYVQFLDLLRYSFQDDWPWDDETDAIISIKYRTMWMPQAIIFISNVIYLGTVMVEQ